MRPPYKVLRKKPKINAVAKAVFEINTRPIGSPMRVSEVAGECKSKITRPFGKYDFQFYVIIQSTWFLLPILARKSLTQTYQFYYC